MTTLTIYWIGRTDITPNLPCLDAPTVSLATLTATGFASTILNSEYLKESDFVFATTSTGNYFLFVSIDTHGIRTFFNPTLPGNVAYTGGINATIGNLPSFSDLSGDIQDSNIPAVRVLQSAFNTPDVNINTARPSIVNVNFTNLASGPITLFTPTGSKNYQIGTVRCLGTSFSGGGGDKNISLLVGGTTAATLLAASAQALTNAGFQAGDTATFPLTGSFLTTITAANPLTLSYTGGTTNYTAGSMSIDVSLIRIA